jgi:hypothetical protein
MIQAWASMKSFRPKDGSGDPPSDGRNGTRNFRSERRSNDTHGSTTDPDALLYRKGRGMEAKLCFLGHVLMENRNGLVVDAERLAALAMVDRLPTASPVTLGADKGFDAEGFVLELRERRVTPHIAQNLSGRRSAVDGRTTRHAGYRQSQRARKRIEEAFGWIKTTAGQARTRLRGIERVRWSFTLSAAAYNLVACPNWSAPHDPAGPCLTPGDLGHQVKQSVDCEYPLPTGAAQRKATPTHHFFNDLLTLASVTSQIHPGRLLLIWSLVRSAGLGRAD